MPWRLPEAGFPASRMGDALWRPMKGRGTPKTSRHYVSPPFDRSGEAILGATKMVAETSIPIAAGVRYDRTVAHANGIGGGGGLGTRPSLPVRVVFCVGGPLLQRRWGHFRHRR